MKRGTLFYFAVAAALLAGMAHLRSDWLNGDPQPTAPASTVERTRPAALWATDRPPAHRWWSFLQRR